MRYTAKPHMHGRGERGENERQKEERQKNWIWIRGMNILLFRPILLISLLLLGAQVEIYWCGREIGFCGPCSLGEMCGCATWAVDYGYGTVFVYLPQTWSQFAASFPGARIWFRVMNADELVVGISCACVRRLKSMLPVHPCRETGDLLWPLSMSVISEMIREVSYPLRKSLEWSLGPRIRPHILLKQTECLKNRDEFKCGSR